MRNILVLVHDDAGQSSRLQAALDMTRAMRGHLKCLDLIGPAAARVASVQAGDTMLADAGIETRRSDVRSRVEASGVSFSWIDRSGALNQALEAVSTEVEMVVLSTPGVTSFPDMASAIGHCLVNLGKAVLAVPSDVPHLNLKGTAMLAWDGSPQAASAMRAAVPLLRFASSVTLVEIDDGSLRAPVADAATYLKQREVRTHTVSDHAFGEKAGVLLLEQIELLKPAYLVMGGFGHPRIVETMFGGVTDRLLQHARIPLLLKN